MRQSEVGEIKDRPLISPPTRRGYGERTSTTTASGVWVVCGGKGCNEGSRGTRGVEVVKRPLPPVVKGENYSGVGDGSCKTKISPQEIQL